MLGSTSLTGATASYFNLHASLDLSKPPQDTRQVENGVHMMTDLLRYQHSDADLPANNTSFGPALHSVDSQHIDFDARSISRHYNGVVLRRQNTVYRGVFGQSHIHTSDQVSRKYIYLSCGQAVISRC